MTATDGAGGGALGGGSVDASGGFASGGGVGDGSLSLLMGANEAV